MAKTQCIVDEVHLPTAEVVTDRTLHITCGEA